MLGMRSLVQGTQVPLLRGRIDRKTIGGMVMITYKTFSVAEAFREASQDATWNKAERAALAAIAKGLKDSNWNQAYMAGEVQKDGREWNGMEEDLRPQTAGVKKDWMGLGHGVAWATGHKITFAISNASEGWNIGRRGFPDLSKIRGAIKRVTGGGYAIEIVTEEDGPTRTEISIWYEDGEILGQGRVFRKGAISSVDCFDPTPEPLSDSFLAEHAEAIVKECATASWMQKGSA